MDCVPNIWGGGLLLCLSGIDGKTNWFNPSVATLLEDRMGFEVHSKREKTLWILSEHKGKICQYLPGAPVRATFDSMQSHLVCADLLHVSLFNGDAETVVKVAPADESTFAGSVETSAEARIFIVVRIESAKEVHSKDSRFLAETDRDICILHLDREVDSCVVDSRAEVDRVTAGQAKDRAQFYSGDCEVRYLVVSALLNDGEALGFALRMLPSRTIRAGEGHDIGFREMMGPLYRRSTEFFEKVCSVEFLDSGVGSAVAKAFSILKANVETTAGRISTPWTTPDRHPHGHMWLWDSALHAVGYRHLSSRIAQECVLSVLSTQEKDGFIPHWFRPDGTHSDITQPPILAWATYKVWESSKDDAFLKKCVGGLSSYLDWNRRNMDENNDGLLEWRRSDESGMDNSSRFYRGTTFNAVDLNCFMANDLNYLALIAARVTENGYVGKIRSTAKGIERKIETLLYDGEVGLYLDRNLDGTFSEARTVCSFLPIFCGFPDAARLERLLSHLTDEREFWSRLPVPSEALNSPTYDKNMWRGSVWLNYNYFIIEGLRRYGLYDLALELRRRTIKAVCDWYALTGSIFEFYDPDDTISPRSLPRKDRFGAIAEFGWSAALFLDMILGEW